MSVAARGYVATNWFTVLDVLAYGTDGLDYAGRPVRAVRVLLDNNGGEPFEATIRLDREGTRLVQSPAPSRSQEPHDV